MTFAVAALLLFLCLAARPAFSADSRFLETRLKTHITSYLSKPGSPFECVVIRSFERNGRIVIPVNSVVQGHVVRATSVGLGIRHERATLQLSFDRFLTPDGGAFPLQARLVAIDNAREQVLQDGTIKGVLAARQPTQLMAGFWHTPSIDVVGRSMVGFTGATRQIAGALSFGPIESTALLALRLALFKFPEPEVHLPPGADLSLSLKNPEGLEEPAEPVEAAPTDLSTWIESEPFTVHRKDGRPAGDIVNVAFQGSREQLENAFSVAGWAKADTRSTMNARRYYFAFNAMRAYATAPVSHLFYKGALPELVFQKSLNTITKRHHVRVWYAGVVEGKELWLGAATHDVGIGFDPRHFKFSHKIDNSIDDERDKVVTDLTFSGCSAAEMQVERTSVLVPTSSNAIGTDGKVSVLPLSGCVPADDAGPGPRPPGNVARRFVRRLILESRNHMLRDNPYYWSFQLVRRVRPSRSAAN